MDKGQDTNDSVKKVVRSKVNKMFAVTLAEIEKQTKDFKIDQTFFTRTSKNNIGFGIIRKKLLDSGNEIVNLIDLILDQVEITPKDAIVNIKDVQTESNSTG